jgi:methylenetetrahydrofolate reductase (NADPH)
MRIDSLLQSHIPTVSFEFSPPRDEAGFTQLYRTIDRLKPLHPSYVSITYGAGGSTRRQTLDLCARIENEIGLRVMAHLTTVGHTQEEIDAILDQLWQAKIENVLALRGDPPQGERYTPTPGGFAYASDLVAHVRKRHPFCVGVAGYPEGHVQCLNRTRDMEHLKQKVDAGASLIITQLFFDNQDFYRFRDDARKIGINVPIIAGIMPILNVSQIKRFVTMCGAKIPHSLLVAIEQVEGDKDAVYKMGVEHSIRQCRELLDSGAADGLHFYTLNMSRATIDIVRALNAKFAE